MSNIESRNAESTRITPYYLCNLIIVQTKDYSERELKYTALVKDKFIEVLSDSDIAPDEKQALIMWTSYIFGHELTIPLSLALTRAKHYKELLI